MTVGARAFVGTAGYMSPEQASREELDGRSDLYAIGIVLWERLRVGCRAMPKRGIGSVGQ